MNKQLRGSGAQWSSVAPHKLETSYLRRLLDFIACNESLVTYLWIQTCNKTFSIWHHIHKQSTWANNSTNFMKKMLHLLCFQMLEYVMSERIFEESLFKGQRLSEITEKGTISGLLECRNALRVRIYQPELWIDQQRTSPSTTQI